MKHTTIYVNLLPKVLLAIMSTYVNLWNFMPNFNWNLRGKLNNLVQLSVLKTSHINYEIVQPRKHTHTHTHTYTHTHTHTHTHTQLKVCFRKVEDVQTFLLWLTLRCLS